MPRVSVITGFYNRAPVLERTINSVLSQSFSDLELIVFDDKSTDGTADRLRRLVDQIQDPRLRIVLHEENIGFVRGLKEAIEISSGEYIAIQGSGDVSLSRRIELQVDLLDNRPDVGAVGGWYFNVQEGRETRRLRRPDADAASFDTLLRANIFSHGEVMMRRSVYESAGGYRSAFTYAQDIDLWLRIAKVPSKFASVKEPIYNRYVQFDGVSYVPRKTVKQLGFAIAARRIALMSEAEALCALRRVEIEGPYAIVDEVDATVQKNISAAAIRMILFGAPASGIEMAKEYVKSPSRRIAIVSFGRFYANRFSWPFRHLIHRAVGIEAQ